MELLLYPDPVLRRRAVRVARIDDEVRALAREMFAVMYRERGVGLAAPQVGWSARLFVVNTSSECDPAQERVYINPEILSAEGEVTEEEGCLSIPGVRGKVSRSAELAVRAQGLDGAPFEAHLEGLDARVFQHELDHLDGILFILRLSATERVVARKVLKKLEADYKKALPSA